MSADGLKGFPITKPRMKEEVITIGSEGLREITDKDLIVFLVAKGIEIKDVKKDPVRNRSLIYFLNTKELEAAVLAYTNRVENINYGDYVAAEKRVRTLLNLQKVS